MDDWRQGTSCMRSLIAKFHNRPSDAKYTDITFRLPDGSLVSGHKLLLAISSPFFEAQFFGLLASDCQDNIIDIQDVDSNSFRRLLDFIYNSEALSWKMESLEYWNLLHAAHMYLVPGLITHCSNKITDFMKVWFGLKSK